VDVQPSPTAVYEVAGSGEIPPRCFLLRAQDQAGNAEANDHPVCFAPLPDGGPPADDGPPGQDSDSADAQSPDGDGDGPAKPASPGGCGCASEPSFPSWILLGALLLLRRQTARGTKWQRPEGRA